MGAVGAAGAEIDENLVRNDLSDLERSEHLAERKRLYLLKHPETKRGGDQRSESARSKRNDFVSFGADTAEKTGRTERAVQQDVQIAESIPEDVRDALRDTPIADSKTDLLGMAERGGALRGGTSARCEADHSLSALDAATDVRIMDPVIGSILTLLLLLAIARIVLR